VKGPERSARFTIASTGLGLWLLCQQEKIVTAQGVMARVDHFYQRRKRKRLTRMFENRSEEDIEQIIYSAQRELERRKEEVDSVDEWIKTIDTPENKEALRPKIITVLCPIELTYRYHNDFTNEFDASIQMADGAGNKPCADEIIMEMQEYKDANAKGKAVMEQVPESIRYRVYAFLHSKWGFGI